MNGLTSVCDVLLDHAPPLLVPPAVEKPVYSTYIVASVLYAVDTVELSTISGRPLIAQPMPLLSARDVAQLAKHRTYDLDCSYVDILGEHRMRPEELRPHQVLFLLHITLSTGSPRIMDRWLSNHADDKVLDKPSKTDHQTAQLMGKKATWQGKCFHPSAATLQALFWNFKYAEEPRCKHISEVMCIRAAVLVAGTSACNIFELEFSEYRVFALDSGLAPFYTVTDVESTLSVGDKGSESHDAPNGERCNTRVLVAPVFLSSLVKHWPAGGSSSTLIALRDTLRHHARLATELVKVGEILVAHGGLLSNKEKKACLRLPICDQLIERWKATAIVAFEQLTFHALCLHLSCALEDENDVAKTVVGILTRVCSKEAVRRCRNYCAEREAGMC